MQCVIAEKQPNRSTYCDDTKKRAFNSQTVRAKENPSLAAVGPMIDKHQTLSQQWKF